MGAFLKEGNGAKYSRNLTNSLRKVEVGITLRDIISEQISVSRSQISLPPYFDSVYASYCYKSEAGLKSDDVLNSILTAAKLTYDKTDSIQKVFLLEILDSSLLNKNLAKNDVGKISHLSVSDDGNFISMSNSSIYSIIYALQDRFGCPIILKDSSIFDKPLDMMLQTVDVVTLKNSMKMYGISIKEIKQTLPFVMVIPK